MTCRVETLFNGQWTDDASLLGEVCAQECNEFVDELEALAAIDELVEVGFKRSNLRVVEID
jgi:hypothetical protein